MKVLFVIIGITLIFNFSGFSQNKLWTVGTAYTIPHKQIEISLFRPSRIGVGRKTELSMHPVGTFIMPHLFVKHIWGQPILFKRKFTISSQHGIYYPSLALKILKNRDFDDSLSSVSAIPQNIAFRNELLISHYLKTPTNCEHGNYLLTLRLGIKNSFSSDETLHPIIYKSIYHRETMVFYPKPVWYIGLDFDASLTNTFNIFADLEYHQVYFKQKAWSIESKVGIMGYSGDQISAFFGVKGAISKLYKSGYDFFAIPIFDISYTFKIKKDKTKEKGLFKTDKFKFFEFNKDDEIR